MVPDPAAWKAAAQVMSKYLAALLSFASTPSGPSDTTATLQIVWGRQKNFSW